MKKTIHYTTHPRRDLIHAHQQKRSAHEKGKKDVDTKSSSGEKIQMITAVAALSGLICAAILKYYEFF